MVYSEPDRESLPLRFADERYPIKGATPAETYLNIPKLIKAAIDTGCDAVHPGYGFLSENASFVKACEDSNLIFVGPSGDAIEKLENKLLARKTMKEAGVPIIPGSDGPVKDENEAVEVCEKIGYPAILKAVYGGGGRGMRIVQTADEALRMFRITKLEALSAFGRDEMYIEKRLTNPRHVEIQAIVDKQGKVVSLGERECTLQRRHQKLLEEAPSVALTENSRAQLNDCARKGLTAAKYANAGTVEFLMEKTGAFYFLEVNKRVQVEHLVTELTTGIDLIEEQLRIASDSKLDVSQNEVQVKGWAMNCRINAEDPRTNFSPSPGTVTRYQAPAGPGIRVDSALFSGYTIPEYYDSLVAKLAAWGRDREEAIARMSVALDEIQIIGVPTTIPLHQTVMREKRFLAGEFDTSYLDELMPVLNTRLAELEKYAVVAAVASKMQNRRHTNQRQEGVSRWRLGGRPALRARDWE
jgi:acetyl-CoA carboxylase biotin carboxylase subunit